MFIDIIDDQTIAVCGETGEMALSEAKRLIKIIGDERWISFSGARYSGNTFTPVFKYTVEVKFKKAP